jgi:hypothetical protein
MRIRIEPTFDYAVYPAESDPLAKMLVELSVQGEDEPSLPSVSADLHLVLDVSGSMNAPDRFPLLARAVEELLMSVDADDRVGIVLFSTEADVVTRPIPGREARAALPELMERMKRSPILFGGATRLAPGLRATIGEIVRGSAPDVRRIYVLTDGELHDVPSCEGLMPELRSLRAEVHVYGFGTAFDPLQLKRLVSDQFGGSVKPICNEQDIVSTFSHVAGVNRRLAATDGVLALEFAENVECGDAWSFRPQERYLGPVVHRTFSRELGAVESERVYSLLVELRLPPVERDEREAIAYARFDHREGDQIRSHRVPIFAPRAPERTIGKPIEVERVARAATVLDALRKEGDRDAELRALKARLELATAEGRDPGLLAALQKQIDVMEGRIEVAAVSDADRCYLEADWSTRAGWIGAV